MAIAQRKRRIIGPSLNRNSASSPRGTRLPSEFIERASNRLEMLAALVGLAGLVQLIVHSVPGLSDWFGASETMWVKQAIFGAAAAISLGMLLTARLSQLPKRRMVDLGQVYFLLLALTASAQEASSPWGEHALAHGVPLTCLPILVFPLILPAEPGRALMTSLGAAATLPLMLFVMPALLGFAPPELSVVGLNATAVLVCALMSWFGARMIYQLGGELDRAQRMGSYQLVAPIGKGGMGEVWRAKHAMLARPAAIKLIRDDRVSNDDLARDRFHLEAQAIASLRSPHTIELYDFGVTEDGVLYFVMELLDGMDLDALVLRHGPAPAERVVHFLKQACHSLAEAHGTGLIHRDIKPANLFVAQLGRDHDVLKLLDFGLAKREVHATVEDVHLTVAGKIQGTPAYMAPEQILGDRPLDGRADLYALGCVAWYLLVGQDVFTGTTATQVMFAHLQSEPDAPSTQAEQAIPPELDAAVMACLAKEPDGRPVDADALSALLDAVPLGRPWSQERARRWWSTVSPAASDPALATPLEAGVP
ncbi:MAG: tRNA A-37 threonylcarbamoyl transferase component Bud32 [Myxococcota bacterium]